MCKVLPIPTVGRPIGSEIQCQLHSSTLTARGHCRQNKQRDLSIKKRNSIILLQDVWMCSAI
jgi:hypothetical protein